MKISSVLCLIGILSQVQAEPITSPVSSIRVTGQGVASARPERAQINVGVLTQEKLSQTAAMQNARAMDAVMVALRKLLGADADIKTVNYSLSPDYQYRPGGSKATISGYSVLNVVRVTVDDVTKVGAVIDAAAQAGANHVESVQYLVRDPAALRSQALREAAAKAKADAETLASALNLKILKIQSVEGSRDVGPAPPEPLEADARFAAAAPEPTPIQPAGIDVTANVTLTVEVSSR